MTMHFLKYIKWNLILDCQRPLGMFASKFQHSDKARSANTGRIFYNAGKSRFYTTGSTISSSQIDSLLRREQRTMVFSKDSFLSRCDVSQLASNRPSEDGWFASRFITSQENGFLFGVLDGHGGTTCMQNVCHRIPDYMATFLLPRDKSTNPSKTWCIANLFDQPENSMAHDFRNDELCRESLKKLVSEKIKVEHCPETDNSKIFGISKAMQRAFLQLDNDLHSEALTSVEGDITVDIVPYLTSVQSGSCVLACYITEHDIFIANTGDCRAVAGVKKQDGTIAAEPLSIEQTSANPHEVKRILNEHPDVEAGSLFMNSRLLGILTPLRAFGNAWLKWDIGTIKNCFNLLYGPEVSRLIPMFYETPPYLTALPDVTHRYLSVSGYKFLILASDGLWDLLNNEEAVAVVENYFKATNRNGILDNAMWTDSNMISDNVATALVRHALGGKNQAKLTSMFSLPFPQVRLYRDDITVMVVMFNNDKAK